MKLQFGWFNKECQLCLSPQDYAKISAKFSILNINRINHEGEKTINKIKENYNKPPPEKYTFKP